MAKRTIDVADALSQDLPSLAAAQGYPSPEAWLSALVGILIAERVRAQDDALIRRARERQALTQDEQSRVKTLLNIA